MINTRFSLLHAYLVGIKIMLEYISFYIAWYGFTVALWFLFFLGFGLYADMLSLEALTHNWSWVGAMAKQCISKIQLNYAAIPGGLSLYELLKHVLPVEILNHSLETMSWKEYISLVIIPKKVTLFISMLVASFVSMIISVGFIKTALSFQSKKEVSFSDFYKYFYLVPEYFVAKILLFFICSAPFIFLIPLHVFFTGTNFLILTCIVAVLSVCLYQRLRFAKYFVIDGAVSALDGITASWKLTQGSVIHLFIFSLCAITIAMNHFSALLMFFFVALDKQAEVSIYRQLMGKK